MTQITTMAEPSWVVWVNCSMWQSIWDCMHRLKNMANHQNDKEVSDRSLVVAFNVSDWFLLFQPNLLIKKDTKQNSRARSCLFYRLKKKYDSVSHKLLWVKLMLAGINTKVINFLKKMYHNISCRLKPGGFLSKKFLYSIGVKQGCVLSLFYSTYSSMTLWI